MTLYSERSCLRVDQGAQSSLLLYLGSGDGAEEAEYVEIPLNSTYLSKLGELRSQYMEAYRTVSSPEIGQVSLKNYEVMMAQIYRVNPINFEESYRQYGKLGKNESMPEDTKILYQSMQADLCANGVLGGAIKPPIDDKRYQKLLAYRIESTSGKQLGCYIFTDLIAFDAQLALNEVERASLKTFWLPEVAPLSVGRNLDESDQTVLEELSFQQNIRPIKDLALLEQRLVTTAVPAYELATVDEYKWFQALSSAWVQLTLQGEKGMAGKAKAGLNSLGQWFVRGGVPNGSSLEEGVNDIIPSAKLMVAGNVLRHEDTLPRMQFHAQVMNQDASGEPVFKQHTFIDQRLYSLLVGFAPPAKASPLTHPVSEMYSGSFLLYGGHPIATLLVVDRAHVQRQAAGMLLYRYEMYQHQPSAEERISQVVDPKSNSQVDGSETQPAAGRNPAASPHNEHVDSGGGTGSGGGGTGGAETGAGAGADQRSAPPTSSPPGSTPIAGGGTGSAPLLEPISSNEVSRGAWFQSTTNTNINNSQCDQAAQVCDPDEPGCADDCTYCLADTAKPGCSAAEMASYRCTPGAADCSNSGVKCSVNPQAAGCGNSADVCATNSSFLGRLFGGGSGCPAVLAPVDPSADVAAFQCN